MREFKFRVFDRNVSNGAPSERMSEPFYLGEDWIVFENYIVPVDTLIKNEMYITEESERPVVMQYAGLKDSNDVEIYEGDIVRLHWEYPEEKPVVIENICDVYAYELDSSKCEVIGNIYENEELLK